MPFFYKRGANGKNHRTTLNMAVQEVSFKFLKPKNSKFIKLGPLSTNLIHFQYIVTLIKSKHFPETDYQTS
jgi:hypothetical protein